MVDYRLCYCKRDRLKYISHLDMMRLMQRAFKRSGLDVWYTEGFNPHLYLNFALPLALGLESECEIMDFRLMEPLELETIRERINTTLPPNMEVLEIWTPVAKTTAIAQAEYQITIEGEVSRLKESWETFFAQAEILMEKKTKKGVKEIDLKPDIQVESAFSDDGMLVLTLRLPAGTTNNLSPLLVLEAWKRVGGPKHAESILRTRVLEETGADFR